MVDISKKLSKIALSIGAVSLRPDNPFTWASGYQMPIYNDNRLLLSNAKYRALIASSFKTLTEQHALEFSVVAGTATAGIPHATTLADLMELPLVYVRAKAKGHGLQNQIEGKIESGSSCILMEDVISTGGSSLENVIALKNAQVKLSACLAIFSYGFKNALEAFEEANCPLFWLFSFDDLLNVAVEENYIKKTALDLLLEWQKSPFEWGEKHGHPKVQK